MTRVQLRLPDSGIAARLVNALPGAVITPAAPGRALVTVDLPDEVIAGIDTAAGRVGIGVRSRELLVEVPVAFGIMAQALLSPDTTDDGPPFVLGFYVSETWRALKLPVVGLVEARLA